MKSTTQMQEKTLRGNFNLLFEFMLAAAAVVIIAILVFNINQDARDDFIADQAVTPTCNASGSGIISGCGTIVNATLDGDEAVAKVPNGLKLLGTAVVFGVILYVIFRVLPFKAGLGSSDGTMQ